MAGIDHPALQVRSRWRRRLIQALTLVIVVSVVLRLTGVIEIPGRLLAGAIALDIVLALVEAAIVIVLGRRVYRSYRPRLERFEAFIATLHEIEPKPVAVLMEKELRAYYGVYRRVRRRRQDGVE